VAYGVRFWQLVCKSGAMRSSVRAHLRPVLASARWRFPPGVAWLPQVPRRPALPSMHTPGTLQGASSGSLQAVRPCGERVVDKQSPAARQASKHYSIRAPGEHQEGSTSVVRAHYGTACAESRQSQKTALPHLDDALMLICGPQIVKARAPCWTLTCKRAPTLLCTNLRAVMFLHLQPASAHCVIAWHAGYSHSYQESAKNQCLLVYITRSI
jgi:hypothetical protein